MLQGAIIVTGASRGIGAATALELAGRGFTVACLSRSGDMPDTERKTETLTDGRLIARSCDVVNEKAFAQTVAEIAEEAGGICGLVNNAGIHRTVKAQDMTTEAFEEVMRINTTAVFAASRITHPYLVSSGRGIIVNIGSFFDRIGVKGSVAYCASKAAVAAVTRCLAAEWGTHGISVINVAPGYILTDVNRDFLSNEAGAAQIKARSFIKRPGEVAEVARLIAALYVEDIPFLTGETICFDGGHSISL